MAKIIYDKSPLNSSERITKEFGDEMTLENILDDLGCVGDCSVEVNGLIPDTVSLDTKFKETDLIRIRKPLHGSTEESGKIIQTVGLIVGIVVSFYNPFIGSAIIAGTGLVGGLLIAKGIKKIDTVDRGEGESAAQVFNLTSARNEARALEPMSLTIGSHRVVPDFASRPYSNFFIPPGTPVTTQTVPLNTFAEVDPANFSGWTTLPSGWLQNNYVGGSNHLFGDENNNLWTGTNSPKNRNLWPYELKIMPGFTNTAGEKSMYEQYSFPGPTISGENILFKKFTFKNARAYTQNGSNISAYGPTVIYHSDPADPYFGKFSFLELFSVMFMGFYGNNDPTNEFTTQNASIFFHSTNPPSYLMDNFVDIYGYLIGDQDVISNVYSGRTNCYHQAAASSEHIFREMFSDSNRFTRSSSNGQIVDSFEDCFLGHNHETSYNPQFQATDENYSNIDQYLAGGSDYNIRKDAIWGMISQLNNSYNFQVNTPGNVTIPEDPKAQRVRHIFHYGIGDLDITDRRLGDTPIDLYQEHISEEVVKTPVSYSLAQGIHETNVKVAKGGKLINNETNFSGPSGSVGGGDDSLYNWITRETPENTKRIEINISGRSFETDDTTGEYLYLATDFQVQYKKDSDLYFSDIAVATSFGSNNSDAVRETVTIDNLTPDKYKVRIRKKDKDSESNRVIQDFSCDSFNFYVLDVNTYIGENREGLTLVSNAQANGDTDALNALCEAKCFVYDGSQWIWMHTRNPAWWFLYYAKGGFLNSSADGSLVYPYSPTIGWVNSAEHPDNTERLFGAGLAEEDIDLDKIQEWAEFCDDKNLNCDLLIRSDSSAHEVLQRIANAGRASVSYYCSKLSVVYENPEEPVSGMFGMSNILKGSFSINYAVEDVPYKIVGKFSDRNKEWKTNKVESVVPNSILDNINIEEIVLDGITDEERAQREVNILAARQAYQRRTYSWSTAIEGVTVRRGDKVYLSHDITCYDQSGRLTGVTVEDGKVTKLHTGVCLSKTTDVMVRFLDGSIEYFAATNDGNKLVLSDPQDLNKFTSTLDQQGTDNPKSDYPGSVIEDIVFFAGPKTTPGKAVRVTGVEPEDGINRFKINAIEEDPVIWAFEYDNTATPEETSFENIVAKIKSASYKKLDNGYYKLEWEMEGAHAAIINQKVGANTTTIQSEGQFTMFKNQAIIDLPEGGVYNLEITPVCFGQDCNREVYRMTIRT